MTDIDFADSGDPNGKPAGVESSWLVRKGRKTSGPWEASKPAGNFRRAILRRQRWTEEASDAQSNA
jgi:hypothetical protein